MARGQARLPSEWLLNCNGVRPHLSMAPRLDHPKKPRRPPLLPALSARIATPAQAISTRNVDEVSLPAVVVDPMGETTVGERGNEHMA